MPTARTPHPMPGVRAGFLSFASASSCSTFVEQPVRGTSRTYTAEAGCNADRAKSACRLGGGASSPRARGAESEREARHPPDFARDLRAQPFAEQLPCLGLRALPARERGRNEPATPRRQRDADGALGLARRPPDERAVFEPLQLAADARLLDLQGLGEPRARGMVPMRSEERRVGKECRSRWSPY